MLKANIIEKRHKNGFLHCSECRRFTIHNKQALKKGQWSECMVCNKTTTRIPTNLKRGNKCL